MGTNKVGKYLDKYNQRGIKNFCIDILSLSLIIIGIPFIITLFLRDEYGITWVKGIQIFLVSVLVLFLISALISLFYKERKKILSLIIFELIQIIMIELFVLGAIIGFIYMFEENIMKLIFILLFVLGLLKVIFDLKKDKDRDNVADFLMSVSTKYGSIIMLLIIVGRWIISFIYPSGKEFSLVGALSPILLVVIFIFFTEYSINKILMLKDALNNQECYRQGTELDIRSWYGSKSKEYKASLDGAFSNFDDCNKESKEAH